MKDELKQYEQDPGAFWKSASMLGDGYDVLERAQKRGWHLIGSWGKSGYDLGSHPYVMIYHANQDGIFYLVYYVEGDVTMYACPTKEIREQVTDELAFFHWKHQEESWVEGYETSADLPEELRGPYRR